MRSLRFIGAALGALACAGAPAQAETLADVLMETHATNSDLEQARLNVSAARENRVQAFAAYGPTVSINGSYGARASDTRGRSIFGPSRIEQDTEPSTATAQAVQQLYTGGRRSGNMDLARASFEGARLELRTAEQNVLLAATDAYLSVWRDEQILQLSVSYVESLERQVSGTQRRFELGEVTRTDVAQATARLAGARANLASAQANLEASRARFEQVVGSPPEALAPAPPAPALPNSIEEARARAAQAHPRILLAEQFENAARARVEIERAGARPQVSLVGRVDEAREADSPDDQVEAGSAVLQFSMPLYEGGFTNSRVRQQRLALESAEAATESRRRETFAEVTGAWSAYQAAQQVRAAAVEQVSAAEQAFRGAERERGLGLRSTIDVLDAEQEWRQAQIALARADAGAILGSYRVLSAAGELSLGALGLE